MAKYGVVRTDNMMGTTVNSYLDSVRFYDSNDEEAEIENGHVVKVGELLVNERELHKATTPAANTDIKEIGLVANPEVFYDERKKNLDEYINEAGQAVRIYYLHTGDEFGVTIDALNVASNYTPKVGDVAELMAGTKLNVKASATANSTQVGKVIAVESTSRYTYYVIRVA